MAFILYQLAQDSFPTDPENMNPIRQLFLVEKSTFRFKTLSNSTKFTRFSLKIDDFEGFRDRRWSYTWRTAFILHQVAQNSFPTDPESMNPIRQFFLTEKSILSLEILSKSTKSYVSYK